MKGVVTKEEILSDPIITDWLHSMPQELESKGFLTSILEDYFFIDYLVAKEIDGLQVLVVSDEELLVVSFRKSNDPGRYVNQFQRYCLDDIQQVIVKYHPDNPVRYEVILELENETTFTSFIVKGVNGQVPPFINRLNKIMIRGGTGNH
ncbi:hypothetical protein SAMN05216389_103183 [Oceanobacillus limi]|uniref:Uncharacterized protein n=1 Tax=Oceanobacillus limi TaxID=930131 RepID=A0A1I0ACJ6_9BACI|nr:hypothetical protein [Oceanobacillus limi]SES91913.1 hypothetical protein SAMN05216389_103183 [Oceanobacillus limi]